MRSLKRVAWLTAGLILILLLPGSRTEIRAQHQILVWAPQPLQPNPWVAPNKPITRLAELRAQNWTETVVNDNLFRGEYICMAPRGQNAEAISSGQSRLVDRSGWANPVHARSPGAIYVEF